MAESKTKPTDVSVDDFLSTVSAQGQAEARQLIAIMHDISGFPATMWGPSIIGFGSMRYESKYSEGDC